MSADRKVNIIYDKLSLKLHYTQINTPILNRLFINYKVNSPY